MSKAKQALEATPEITENRILFDFREPQTFKFSLHQKGRDIPISHTLLPIADARYFQLSEELESLADRLKKISSSIFVPKEKVWDEHCESATGYPQIDEWKSRVSQDDKVGVINACLRVEPDDEPETEEVGELVYDFDALTEIYFTCYHGSRELFGMTHRFREFTRTEKDEYLSIMANQPIESAIASAVKMSKAEKLVRLGRKLLMETEGYADGSPVPAWHLEWSVQWYFMREIARQGKY